MVESTVQIYGRVDILYSNAGTSQGRVLTAQTTEEEWDRVVDVNLKGVFLGSKYTIPLI